MLMPMMTRRDARRDYFDADAMLTLYCLFRCHAYCRFYFILFYFADAMLILMLRFYLFILMPTRRLCLFYYFDFDADADDADADAMPRDAAMRDFTPTMTLIAIIAISPFISRRAMRFISRDDFAIYLPRRDAMTRCDAMPRFILMLMPFIADADDDAYFRRRRRRDLFIYRLFYLFISFYAILYLSCYLLILCERE
jgi:hypothetical protein